MLSSMHYHNCGLSDDIDFDLVAPFNWLATCLLVARVSFIGVSSRSRVDTRVDTLRTDMSGSMETVREIDASSWSSGDLGRF